MRIVYENAIFSVLLA